MAERGYPSTVGILPSGPPDEQSRELESSTLGKQMSQTPAHPNSEEGSGTAQPSEESNGVPTPESTGGLSSSGQISFCPCLHFCLPPAHVADHPSSGSIGHPHLEQPVRVCPVMTSLQPPKAGQHQVGGMVR